VHAVEPKPLQTNLMHSKSFRLRTLFALVAVAAIIAALSGFVVRSSWWNGGVRPVTFEPDSWRRADLIGNDRTSRSQMVDDLLDRYDFVGWHRQDVERLLGVPDAVPSETGSWDWEMVYLAGSSRCFVRPSPKSLPRLAVRRESLWMRCAAAYYFVVANPPPSQGPRPPASPHMAV
jgi:hypothetical protein